MARIFRKEESHMNKKHLNLIFPHWQGGGPDISTYYGTLELRGLYFNDIAYEEIAVSTEDISPVQEDILGYTEIYDQLNKAKALIEEEEPETIFTIGGSCDADVTSISYLNDKYNKDMTILYIDAHGDLNTPESSDTKFFYGMPLRALIGESEEKIVDLFPTKVDTSQILMLGTRDLDAPEKQYVEKENIPLISVETIETNMDYVLEQIRQKGRKRIYVHIDLDVLEKAEFAHVPLPVDKGLRIQTLLKLIENLKKEFDIVGVGLFECQPMGNKKREPLNTIIDMGLNL